MNYVECDRYKYYHEILKTYKILQHIVCFSKFSLFIAKVESLEDDSSGIICGNPEPLTYVWLRS